MNPYGNAAIGFVGDIGSSIINNQFAEESAERNYARQLQFWEMQNDYNTPLMQKMRLEQAGINPNQFYSNGNMQNTADTAPNVAKNEYAQKGVMQMQMLQHMMQLGNLQADIKLKDAQARATDAQAGLSTSQTDLNRFTLSFEESVKELRKQGIINDNELKYANQQLAYTNANDLEQTRQVRIDAMTSQIAQASANAYRLRKAGKLDESQYNRVLQEIRNMRVSLSILERQDKYEDERGAPLSVLTMPGIMGSGISLRRVADVAYNLGSSFGDWVKSRLRNLRKRPYSSRYSSDISYNSSKFDYNYLGE